eukprot:1428143-Rhodomonas_salina.1
MAVEEADEGKDETGSQSMSGGTGVKKSAERRSPASTSPVAAFVTKQATPEPKLGVGGFVESQSGARAGAGAEQSGVGCDGHGGGSGSGDGGGDDDASEVRVEARAPAAHHAAEGEDSESRRSSLIIECSLFNHNECSLGSERSLINEDSLNTDALTELALPDSEAGDRTCGSVHSHSDLLRPHAWRQQTRTGIRSSVGSGSRSSSSARARNFERDQHAPPPDENDSKLAQWESGFEARLTEPAAEHGDSEGLDWEKKGGSKAALVGVESSSAPLLRGAHGHGHAVRHGRAVREERQGTATRRRVGRWGGVDVAKARAKFEEFDLVSSAIVSVFAAARRPRPVLRLTRCSAVPGRDREVGSR